MITCCKAVLMTFLALLLTASILLASSGNIEKRENVCMMQDMVLGKAGIPIQYEGETYYGCCEMCKE